MSPKGSTGRRARRRRRHTLALDGTVLVLGMIGGLKFTAYEAEAIRPLVETSPLLSWAYLVFSVRGFSSLLGVIEPATVALLALCPLDRRAGVIGGLLAAGTFAITSTVLVTGPAWEPSLGGFPALSPAGGFLVKDLVLLGVALSGWVRASAGWPGRARSAGIARPRSPPADGAPDGGCGHGGWSSPDALELMAARLSRRAQATAPQPATTFRSRPTAVARPFSWASRIHQFD